MRALPTTLALLAVAAGLAGTAAADPAQCASGHVTNALNTFIVAKNGGEAVAFDAVNGYVDDATSAFTSVTLDVPPQGPLNPATLDSVADHTTGAADGAALQANYGASTLTAPVPGC
jgi:hypothetical protein